MMDSCPDRVERPAVLAPRDGDGNALPCRPMSRATSAPPTEAGPAACLNCGESFGEGGERRPRFCPACGQETTLRPPTLGEFAQQFGGAYLATEGALWRSLRLLL